MGQLETILISYQWVVITYTQPYKTLVIPVYRQCVITGWKGYVKKVYSETELSISQFPVLWHKLDTGTLEKMEQQMSYYIKI